MCLQISYVIFPELFSCWFTSVQLKYPFQQPDTKRRPNFSVKRIENLSFFASLFSSLSLSFLLFFFFSFLSFDKDLTISVFLSFVHISLQFPSLFRRMASSVMLRRVARVRTDVSEKINASIIRVTIIYELGTLAVTSNRSTLRRNTKFLHLKRQMVDGR
jgi:hypothetical protein